MNRKSLQRTCGVPNPLKAAEQTVCQYFSGAHVDVASPQTHRGSMCVPFRTNGKLESIIKHSSDLHQTAFCKHVPMEGMRQTCATVTRKVQPCGTCTCNQTGGGQRSPVLRKGAWLRCLRSLCSGTAYREIMSGVPFRNFKFHLTGLKKNLTFIFIVE